MIEIDFVQNGLETDLIQFGLNDSILDKHGHTFINHSQLIFLIPGNPGSIKFYKKFMSLLYEKMNIPVIGISHGGHTKSKTLITSKGNRTSYELDGQIEHKLAFIRDYIPSHVDILFISHSVGTYINLKLIEKLGSSVTVPHSILLFPTIEHLGKTGPGTFYNFIFNWLKYFLLFLAFLINFLPVIFKETLLKLVFKKFKNTPKCCYEATGDILSFPFLRNIITLTLSEFKKIKTRDAHILDQYKDTLSLIYSDIDIWSPMDYYYDIKSCFPNNDIQLSFKGIDHAFVLDLSYTTFVCEVASDIFARKIKINQN